MKKLIYILSLGLLLAGCTFFQTSIEYVIPQTPVQPVDKTLGVDIRVAIPTLSSTIGQYQVVAFTNDNQINPIIGAQWRGGIDCLFQERIISAFKDSLAFRYVEPDFNPTFQPYYFVSNLQRFHAVYKENSEIPTVYGELECSLINMKTGTIIAKKSFTENVTTSDSSANSLIRSFGIVSDSLISQCTTWTIKSIHATNKNQKHLKKDNLPLSQNEPITKQNASQFVGQTITMFFSLLGM